MLFRVILYPGISLVSLALGAIEGFYDTPCAFKSALVAIPLVSLGIGASAEFRKRDDPNFTTGIVESFDNAVASSLGAIKGGGLSLLCEGVGYGLVKFIPKVFS